jgi:hypothetical protein
LNSASQLGSQSLGLLQKPRTTIQIATLSIAISSFASFQYHEAVRIVVVAISQEADAKYEQAGFIWVGSSSIFRLCFSGS